MRIVAGELRGRRIAAPRGETTRPTTDRVRESLFSTLTSLAGPDLGGGPTLDAFAGSGALGLEALSRGAGPVTFVERDRGALSALRDNVASLGVGDRTTVRQGDAFSLAGRRADSRFALILLDPPYTLDPVLTRGLLDALARSGSVADGALVSWEHAADDEPEWPTGYEPVVAKRYGTSAIDIARFTGGVGTT